VDHFIEFISKPEFVQDMAFGTKTMKLDSGEKITIPAYQQCSNVIAGALNPYRLTSGFIQDETRRPLTTTQPSTATQNVLSRQETFKAMF
jgi:hypothetical protein